MWVEGECTWTAKTVLNGSKKEEPSKSRGIFWNWRNYQRFCSRLSRWGGYWDEWRWVGRQKKRRKKKTTWQQQWSPLESPSNKSSTKKYLYLPQVSLSGFYSTTLLLRAPAGVCETASLNDTSAVRVPKPKCIGRSMALWISIAFNCLSATRRHFEAIIYYSNSVYDKWYREK